MMMKSPEHTQIWILKLPPWPICTTIQGLIKNFGKPEIIAVIILKFDQYCFVIPLCVQKTQNEWQTVWTLIRLQELSDLGLQCYSGSWLGFPQISSTPFSILLVQFAIFYSSSVRCTCRGVYQLHSGSISCTVGTVLQKGYKSGLHKYLLRICMVFTL